MDRELWERIQELLPSLLPLPPEERESFLADRSRREPELASELRRLLETPASGFLDAPDLDPAGAEDDRLPAGRRVAEFEIVRELGRGGMGVVYLARQASLGRLVALKVLPASSLPAAERLSRFRVEALAAARLRHPNIVHVISAGRDGDLRYIAMELVEGPDLGSVIAALRRGEGHEPMPPFDAPGYTRRAAEIVHAVACALHYAHGAGILHRDVKPQNILLDRGTGVFLVDFGLAKDLGADSISVSGQILGTPYYMSPEQALARRVEIDGRTDVFSLGAVLYELLTLERPFQGDTLRRVLSAISFSDPVAVRKRNPRVHRDIETICFKALEKSPARRFASAGAFAEELERFLANEPLSIRRTWPVERVVRRIRRNRAASALAVALAAALLALPLAWRVARAADAERALARTERELAAPDTPAAALAAERARLLDLRGRVSADQERRVSAALDAIRSRGLERKGLWRDALARALEAAGQPGWSRADALFEEERAHRADARLLLPDDPELEAAHDVALPTVTVSGPAGLRVSVREIDLLTGLPGPPRPLGTTPLEGVALRRGSFRFEIEEPGRALCELDRLLDRPGERLTLVPTLRPTAEATTGMVALPATRFACAYEDRGAVEATVEPCWIDLTAVTIAQYRAYLRATGAAPPRFWSDAFPERTAEILLPASEAPTPWDDRPIAGVRWEEARAYAEWCGKRLPTLLELDLATRGAGLRRYPWTDASRLDVDEVLAHAVLLDERVPRDPLAPPHDALVEYLERTLPVTALPESRSAFGLFHAFGNVKVWTTTYAVTRGRPGAADELTPDLGSVVIHGKGWDSPVARSGVVFGLDRFEPIPVGLAPFSLGFRCAKSAR